MIQIWTSFLALFTQFWSFLVGFGDGVLVAILVVYVLGILIRNTIATKNKE